MSAPRIIEDWQAQLRALPENWDTYGGKPISEAAIKAVQDFYAVPCGNGGIQLEVHQNGYDIEICIGPDGSIISALVAHEVKR